MPSKLFFIDCDSTLSSLEGIDELARLRGAATFEECQNMTNRAMDGEIALEDVYGERLKLIRPNRDECVAIGERYIETVEPDAKSMIGWLKEHGWAPIIVSGGITQVIEPFAGFLGVDTIHAVDLVFDAVGGYSGFVESCATARMGGKIEIIEGAKRANPDALTVMVGDGSSDLETTEVVDLFVGFGGFIERKLVKERSPCFARSLKELPDLISTHFDSA